MLPRVRPPIRNNQAVFTIDDDDDFNYSHETTETKMKNNLKTLIKNYPKDKLLKKILENKCPICLEAFNMDQTIGFTNCCHLFHRRCIDESLRNNKTRCATCRFELKDSVIMNVKFNLQLEEPEII